MEQQSPNGSARATQWRMWQTLSSSFCKMFSVWHDQSSDHILPLGAKKQGLCRGDVAGARPKGGSNKFQLRSSSVTVWLFFFFLFGEVCYFAPRYVLTKYFSLLHFKLLAGSSYTSSTDQLQSCWVRWFQIWIFVQFILWYFFLKIGCLKLWSPEDRPCVPQMQSVQKPNDQMSS